MGDIMQEREDLGNSDSVYSSIVLMTIVLAIVYNSGNNLLQVAVCILTW